MDSLLNKTQPEVVQQEPEVNEQRPDMQQGGLSFTSDQVEKSIKEQLDPKKIKQLDKILTAGNKLLFGKDTHYQVLDQIEGTEGDQLVAAMAEGAMGMTEVLIEKSGGTLPGDLIAPAATILITRVSEFLNESGMTMVTDDIFEEVMHVYTVKLMDKYDPESSKRMRGGQEPQPAEQPTQQTGAGLLNNMGGT